MGSASLAWKTLDSVCCALNSCGALNSSERTNCPDPDSPSLASLLLTPSPHKRGLSVHGKNALESQGNAAGVSARRHGDPAVPVARDRLAVRAEGQGVFASGRVPLRPPSCPQSLPFTVRSPQGPPLKRRCLPRGPREAKQLPSLGACKIFNKGQGTIDL